jgi:hypothetical protein
MFNSLMGKYSGPGLSSALDRPFAAIGGAGFTKGPSNTRPSISSLTGGQRVVSTVSPGENAAFVQSAAMRLSGLPTSGPVYFEQTGSGHGGGPSSYPYWRIGLCVDMALVESTYGATSAPDGVSIGAPGMPGFGWQVSTGLYANSGGAALVSGATAPVPSNGTRFGFAVDIDAGHVWLQIGDDVWQNGRSPDDTPWGTFPTGRVVGPVAGVVGDGVSRQATVDTYYESSGFLWEPTSYFI